MSKDQVFTAVAVGLGIAVVIAILLTFIGRQDEANQVAPPTQVAERQSLNTGNPQNDRLLALSPESEAQILGQLVPDGCVGNRAFYRGMLKRTGHETRQEAQIKNALSQTGAAFWSVSCTDGSSYEIEIPVDERADSRVLSCTVVRALGDDCFNAFPK